LICLQWYILVLTLRLAVYTLFGKNKIKFGQNIFHPQNYALPYTYGHGGGGLGATDPKNFSISSNFVIWEAASETKILLLAWSQRFCPHNKFWAGYATERVYSIPSY